MVVVIVVVGAAVVAIVAVGVDVVVVELATASGEEINHKSCDLLRAGSNDLVIFLDETLESHKIGYHTECSVRARP